MNFDNIKHFIIFAIGNTITSQEYLIHTIGARF